MIDFSSIVSLLRLECTSLHINVQYAEYPGFPENELIRPKIFVGPGLLRRKSYWSQAWCRRPQVVTD